jgi:pimeloyl-ACP methyl ester carboxylesterase
MQTPAVARRTLLAALCVCLLAPALRAWQATSPALQGKPAVESRFFESGGAKLRYVDVGRGEPVVLIHGFAADLELNWIRPGVLPALAKDFRVVALDCRGHGKSDKPHDAARYGTWMVRDVAALLDHLGIRRAHIVGYSMGGNIAAKFVTMYPDRAATVTLGGSSGHRARTEEHDREDEELASSLEQGKSILPLLRRLAPPNQPKAPDAMLEQASRMVIARNDPLALAAVTRTRRALAVGDDELKAVRVPLQAIVGTADPAIAGVQALKELLPALRVVAIEGATHVGAPRGTPSRPEFVPALREFIAAHPVVPTSELRTPIPDP